MRGEVEGEGKRGKEREYLLISKRTISDEITLASGLGGLVSKDVCEGDIADINAVVEG